MATTALAPYGLMTSGVDLYIRSDRVGVGRGSCLVWTEEETP
jgi:hypothetical protein